MAKFMYRMQNILNIKYKVEEQVKAEFADANYRYNLEVDKLNSYVSKKHMLEEELKELYRSKLDLKKIRNTIASIDKMKELIELQIIEVNKANEVVEQVREKLAEAMIDRKTHETLKEKAFEEFLEELKKEDDKVIDELVAYRFRTDEKQDLD